MDIDNAFGIQQTASVFLTGTLPLAMKSEDPVVALCTAAEERNLLPVNCLPPLALALDTEANENQRCSALDELETAGIQLDTERLRALIQDASSEVARYSLGFLRQGPEAATLLSIAESCAHSKDGSPFREDLELLKSMLNSSFENGAANKTIQPTASASG